MKSLKIFAVAILALASTTAFAQKNEIILLAHRGGCGEGMENVEGTFKKSLAAGIKAFEIDVRLTKDGKIVLQHDHTLKRTAGVDKAVEDLTEKELREITLNDGSKLMFLDEFLALMSNYPGLYIEFEMKCKKYDDEMLSKYCDKLVKAVLKAQPEGSAYCISSFDVRALRYVKTNFPEADIILITGEGCTKNTQNIAEALGAKRIAANINKTSRDDMKRAHRKGFIVNLWPGKSDDSLLCAWAIGADIHCTDYPSHMLEYAKKNVSWLTIK